MQPARETAGADIPFPLIKETRPSPLRDAEVRRTHYTDHERKSNHMKPTYTNTQELPYTLSVEEMAAFLGISRVGAYNLSHSKGFPSKRIGKRILIPRDAFLAWLKDLPEVSEAYRPDSFVWASRIRARNVCEYLVIQAKHYLRIWLGDEKFEKMKSRIVEAILYMRENHITITKTSLAEELQTSRQALNAPYLKEYLNSFPEFNPDLQMIVPTREMDILKNDNDVLRAKIKAVTQKNRQLKNELSAAKQEAKEAREKYEYLLGQYQVEVGNKIIHFIFSALFFIQKAKNRFAFFYI